MPTKTIDLSIMYQGQDKALLDVKHEEESLCWLWAFPHLVPWPCPVIWLYTAVTGNNKWPGDLWGVDSQGDLLVVECKQCKHSDDPFVDFKNYHHFGRPELSAFHWQEKFQKHLKAELAFPDCLQERPKNKTDGILPRSNQRIHLRRWQTLGGKIDKRIRSPQFRTEAIKYLRCREERKMRGGSGRFIPQDDTKTGLPAGAIRSGTRISPRKPCRLRAWGVFRAFSHPGNRLHLLPPPP
ncbi:MAG: hypothetical protein H6Q42_2681 [Deltaproteobacteria bacterium]|nr:hypothetical protein [Deltaproteobacteria bacterium]